MSAANRFCPCCHWPLHLPLVYVGPVGFCCDECRDRYVSERKAVAS